MSKGCNKGRVWSSGKGQEERSKGRGGEMIALPSRVPGYTTKLTTPKVAVVPKLGGGAGCHRDNGGGCSRYRMCSS